MKVIVVDLLDPEEKAVIDAITGTKLTSGSSDHVFKYIEIKGDEIVGMSWRTRKASRAFKRQGEPDSVKALRREAADLLQAITVMKDPNAIARAVDSGVRKESFQNTTMTQCYKILALERGYPSWLTMIDAVRNT